MDLKERGCEDGSWIELAHIKRRILVLVVVLRLQAPLTES
jgi:hypothetical protein